MAFLVPAAERLLRIGSEYRPGGNVGMLVLSPTRELVCQIGDQAERLLRYHPDLLVQVMYGGTKMGRDTGALGRHLPMVLVATPGRLLDNLEGGTGTITKIHGRKFADIVGDVRIVVLDETDRLLNAGFRTEVRKILTYLPRREKRQTLLFSATLPESLRSVMADAMRNDFAEVDCIEA